MGDVISFLKKKHERTRTALLEEVNRWASQVVYNTSPDQAKISFLLTKLKEAVEKAKQGPPPPKDGAS